MISRNGSYKWPKKDVMFCVTYLLKIKSVQELAISLCVSENWVRKHDVSEWCL